MTLREDFVASGWVIVRGVVPAGELASIRRTFSTLIPEVAYPPQRDGVVWEITGAAAYFPPLARVAHDGRYGALVAAALGCARVQLLQDSLLYKPARDGGSVEWHQDHTYVGFLTPPSVVSLRLALFPEDLTSGCMRVVDGSHRWGPVGAVRALSEPQVDSLLPSLSPEQAASVERATPLELEPGDVSIHHCLTLHGSAPNRSDHSRKTVILRMFDGACRLDRSRLPPGTAEHFPTDEEGRPAASSFPVVHDASGLPPLGRCQ